MKTRTNIGFASTPAKMGLLGSLYFSRIRCTDPVFRA